MSKSGFEFRKKNVVKNGFWLYLLQMFNTVVPLLVLPYVTRILGSTRYGVFSIALNLIGYFQVVVEYGFDMSATRKVALLPEEKSGLSKIFSTVLISRITLFALCSAFTIICGFVLKTKQEIVCLFILLVSLMGYTLQQNWLFQGMHEMKFISVINIISRIISVALIFVLVTSKEDLYLYCLLNSMAPFLSGLFALYLSKKRYNLRFTKVRPIEVWMELKEGWYVFTTQLSSKVFGAIGITFLGFFAANSIVGIYSAIQKIPNIMILAWLPISQIIYPIASKHFKDSYMQGRNFVFKLRRRILPIFIFGAVCVGGFSKAIVGLLYGVEYVQYYYWIIPLLLWLIISINNNFLGIQILLASGQDKQYSKCFQLGVIATIFFNFCFIYFWGGTGAAWAPAISEAVLGITLSYEVRKRGKENAL